MCSRMKKNSDDKRAGATILDGKKETYGLKILNNSITMTNFIILIVAILVVFCNCVNVEGRNANAKYLEYLNDLDRSNAELALAEMHNQWPFTAYQNTQLEESEENKNNDNTNIDNRNNNKNNNNQELDFNVFAEDDEGTIREQTEKLDKLLKHEINQKYRTNFPDFLNKLDSTAFNGRENSPSSHQLNQYTRYNNPSQDERFRDLLARNKELAEIKAAQRKLESEGINPLRTAPKPKPKAKPRPVEEFNLENYQAHVIEAKTPPTPKPIRKSKVSYDLSPADFYGVKNSEDFPPSDVFGKVGTTNDSKTFGLSPLEPRFFRDSDGNYQNFNEYKAKMAGSNEPFQNIEIFPENEIEEREYSNRGPSVKAVPFQPDATQPDTAGVYVIAVVAGISAAATVGLIAVGIGWYKCGNCVICRAMTFIRNG